MPRNLWKRQGKVHKKKRQGPCENRGLPDAEGDRNRGKKNKIQSYKRDLHLNFEKLQKLKCLNAAIAGDSTSLREV